MELQTNQLVLDGDEEEEKKEVAREVKQIERDLKRAWEGMEKLS